MSDQKNWPTPNASDSNQRGTTQGKRKSPNLSIAALAAWPTPATRDHHAQGANHNTKAQSSSLATIAEKKNWPTPTAAPQGGRHEYAKDRSHGRGGGRDLQSEATARLAGKLNPNWVEQLMGLPVGGTQLPREWTDD